MFTDNNQSFSTDSCLGGEIRVHFSTIRFFFKSFKGVSLSRTFEKSIFFLFHSMELLSENIVAKFYSPYRNSFDGRVKAIIINFFFICR